MTHKFLAIESATTLCSVALFENDRLIDHQDEGGDYSHAEKLAPFVDQLLERNATSIKDLSAIAVSSGPGSYTGLRIGLSLAKGLCFAADLPLISISTLDGMAWAAISQLKDPNAFYTSMIDARRMEVYTKTFDSKMNLIHDLDNKIIDEHSFKEELQDQKVYFIGDGAVKCKEVLSSPQASFPEGDFTSSKNWGELILSKFKSEEFEDLAYFEPNYLKSFNAIKPKPMV